MKWVLLVYGLFLLHPSSPVLLRVIGLFFWILAVMTHRNDVQRWKLEEENE